MNLDDLLQTGKQILAEGSMYELLRRNTDVAFDAHIAALCREHGVDSLLTEDRDFTRFPGFRLIDLEQDPDSR